MRWHNLMYSDRVNKNSRFSSFTDELNGYDYLIIDPHTSTTDIEGYALIYSNESCELKIFEKIKRRKKMIYDTIQLQNIHFDTNEYLIFSADSLPPWTNEPFSMRIVGKLTFNESPKTLKIHAEFLDEKGANIAIQHSNLSNYSYPRKSFQFSTFSKTFEPQKIKNILVRIENPEHRKLKINHLKLEFLQE